MLVVAIAVTVLASLAPLAADHLSENKPEQIAIDVIKVASQLDDLEGEFVGRHPAFGISALD